MLPALGGAEGVAELENRVTVAKPSFGTGPWPRAEEGSREFIRIGVWPLTIGVPLPCATTLCHCPAPPPFAIALCHGGWPLPLEWQRATSDLGFYCFGYRANFTSCMLSVRCGV